MSGWLQKLMQGGLLLLLLAAICLGGYSSLLSHQLASARQQAAELQKSLAQQAGLPDGVLNVVPGYGHDAGKALALHRDVDALTFTGSTPVAKQLMIYAGESNMKRVWLEAGGKSANIVFADCPDLDQAARSAAAGIFYNQGQVCIAGTRLLVEASIEQAFLQALRKHAAAFAPGDPLDPDRKFGTVGAVALDALGNLAAATSTGGMTNKQAGRVGDTPIIGAGCYANNATVAVSSTGTGEIFMRGVAAYDVSALIEYGDLSLQAASDRVVMEKLPALGGSGGMIAVDRHGNIALPFNCEGMYRGFGYVGDAPSVGIYR